MISNPGSKYRPFPPVALPNRQWPNRTLTARAHLVQRRSPRWQPGARRADERLAETRALRRAGEVRLQGNRGRLSLRVEHRVRTSTAGSSRKAASPTTSPSSARAGARGLDREDRAVADRREARRSSTSTTPPRPRSAAWSSAWTKDEIVQDRRARRAVDQGPPAAPRRHGRAACSIRRKFLRDRSRVRARRSARPSWTSGSRRPSAR